MHLLYLDDSGSADNPKEHCPGAWGRLHLPERQVYRFTHELDNLAARLVPSKPESVEFHASEIFSGREEPWKSLTRRTATGNDQGSPRRAGEFKRQCSRSPPFFRIVRPSPASTPMEVAFEDICSRF